MIRVFYCNTLHSEFSDPTDYGLFRVTCDREIYNGGYVYVQHPPRHVPGSTIPIPNLGNGWYRIDGTPVLEYDVPAETRLTNLILQ